MARVDVGPLEGAEEELCWSYKKEVVMDEQLELTSVIRVTPREHNWELVVFKEFQNLLAPVITSPI